MKTYIISEIKLARLLKAEMELEALECSGVDNWGFYGEHWDEYFAYPDVDYPEGWDVEDKIEFELQNQLDNFVVFTDE